MFCAKYRETISSYHLGSFDSLKIKCLETRHHPSINVQMSVMLLLDRTTTESLGKTMRNVSHELGLHIVLSCMGCAPVASIIKHIWRMWAHTVD